jgi:hypothetical protein
MNNIITGLLADYAIAFNYLLNVIFQSIFCILGLSLWNKLKFPFSWRRVWSIFFLILSTEAFMDNLLRLFPKEYKQPPWYINIPSSPKLSILLNIFMVCLFFILGLSLWNKQKFPFSWRKVWSALFLLWGFSGIFSRFLSCFE